MDYLNVIEKTTGKLNSRKKSNAKSVAVALENHGAEVGLNQPHRLAQYLAQLAHESMGFQYDREVWGPTAAQKRYEGRRDLGNTQRGDGKKFSGKGPIQVTGRANTREFRDWCRKKFPSLDVPDFEDTPQQINTNPWEGLTGVWYWDTRRLNRYADTGDIEMVTRRINGGLNGYQDRIDWCVKFSLVLGGFGPHDVTPFQKKVGLVADGIAGPKTRASLHTYLVTHTNKSQRSVDVKAAPVVADKPVVPEKIEEDVKRRSGLWEKITGGSFGIGGLGAAVFGMDWQTIAAVLGAGVVLVALIVVFRQQLIATIKDVRAEVQT
jgi:putative chitinase